MVLTTSVALVYSSGVATYDASAIATAYGKTVRSVFVQLNNAGSTIITSATTTSNKCSIRAYNIASDAAYAGTIQTNIFLVLA